MKMGNFFQQFPKVLPISAALMALVPCLAFCAGTAKNNTSLNQHDLQVLSRQTNDKGADESLKNSTVYAMQALMDLSATRLTSAAKNGYNAYGKFRNSENLDRMKDINALNANSLTSIGSGSISLPTKTVTTFRRIDASFLHQGEAGKVADLFEKQSGMKRETFLTQMAEVSEKKIKRTDPQMIDKAFGNFEKFIDKIPNAEFRKNVEKNINLVPEIARRGMIAQAVTKLAGFFADTGSPGANPTLDSSITDAANPQLASNPAPANSAAASATPKDERTPAGMGELGKRQPLAPLTAKERLRNDKNILGSVVISALQTQVQEPAALPEVQATPQLSDVEETIFEQITRRYRALTPLISALP